MPLNPTPLRNMVNRWLTDECTIRADVEPVFDAEEGEYVDELGDVVYTGACRVRPAPMSSASLVVIGDAPRPLARYEVTLPWDTVWVNVNHLVTVTESDDPQLVDRVLRVVDVQYGTNGVHRRLTCEDILTLTFEEVGS